MRLQYLEACCVFGEQLSLDAFRSYPATALAPLLLRPSSSSRALLQRAVGVAVEGSRRSAILGLLRDNCEHLQHMATPCAVWH